MENSFVSVSMRDDNNLNCSYAIIKKVNKSVILILKDKVCAIFDYEDLKCESEYHYLLLKHFENEKNAYKDFLKLIGKMCKKSITSKYFLNHKDEDNRMVCVENGNSHSILVEEKDLYKEEFEDFKKFVQNIIDRV